MTNKTDQHNAIQAFESQYGYDAGFMHELVDHLPGGYEKFEQFKPMAYQRDVLPKDVFWIARIAAMQTEDCGGCLQLSLRMAKEDGVSAAVLKAVVTGRDLSDSLQRVARFSRAVARDSAVDSVLFESMQQDYNTAQLLELGICIASAKVFPTIKRAISATHSCDLMDFQY